jgi:hypothetical protein
MATAKVKMGRKALPGTRVTEKGAGFSVWLGQELRERFFALAAELNVPPSSMARVAMNLLLDFSEDDEVFKNQVAEASSPKQGRERVRISR